jgi:hypothetical protein
VTVAARPELSARGRVAAALFLAGFVLVVSSVAAGLAGADRDSAFPTLCAVGLLCLLVSRLVAWSQPRPAGTPVTPKRVLLLGIQGMAAGLWLALAILLLRL